MSQIGRPNRGPGAAAENRAALLVAAREVFADAGYDAPLNAVARAAGVGQGVLYRHFPDRASLAIAVFEENVRSLEVLAGSPGTTLDGLLRRVADVTVGSTAFVDMLAPSRDQRLLAVERRVRQLVTVVLDRDRLAGTVGGGLQADDVMLALLMLAGAVGRVAKVERAETAARVLALLRRAWSVS